MPEHDGHGLALVELLDRLRGGRSAQQRHGRGHVRDPKRNAHLRSPCLAASDSRSLMRFNARAHARVAANRRALSRTPAVAKTRCTRRGPPRPACGERSRAQRACEGDSRRAQLVENPPHPAPSAPTSPRKRAEVTEFAARSEINLDTETQGTRVTTSPAGS